MSYAPVQYPPQPTQQPQNGLGTAGFVLGLIGLVFSPIPLIGVVAWPLVILGLIFSAIGFGRARSGRATNRGLAVAGIVVSIIGLLICVLWVAVISKAADDVHQEATRVVAVQYQAGGDAKDVTISYTTFGEDLSTSQETVAALPWTKEIQTNGFGKGGSMTVTAGADGGTVTCTVTVDGAAAVTNTAKGPFATASCTDF